MQRNSGEDGFTDVGRLDFLPSITRRSVVLGWDLFFDVDKVFIMAGMKCLLFIDRVAHKFVELMVLVAYTSSLLPLSKDRIVRIPKGGIKSCVCWEKFLYCTTFNDDKRLVNKC